MTTHLSPQPFDQYRRALDSARYRDVRGLPGTAVESEYAFDEMRAHLQDLHKGLIVVDSAVDIDGQIIDYVPDDLHPATRRWNDAPATPPEAPPEPETYEPTMSSGETTNLLPQQRDSQPPGTLAMYRTTLAQLSRFPNLAAFRTKEDVFGEIAAPAAAAQKHYATGEQDIDCVGGASKVNVWRPFASPTLQSTFSQQWYRAIEGGTLLQTVECGWHIDYARYNNSEPHLFVYSTRDNYKDGHSYFNEDSGAFRTVTNPYVRPGAPLLVSQTDGTQVEYKMGFYRNNDGWWFYFDDHPIGYYPTAWFNNGPLTTKATRATFGGEVGTGFSLWPPMGSGQFAAAGYRKAAYQRAVFVHSIASGPVFATLSDAGSVTGPCYTLDITNNSPSEWATYLFFGGPGGNAC